MLEGRILRRGSLRSISRADDLENRPRNQAYLNLPSLGDTIGKNFTTSYLKSRDCRLRKRDRWHTDEIKFTFLNQCENLLAKKKEHFFFL